MEDEYSWEVIRLDDYAIVHGHPYKQILTILRWWDTIHGFGEFR
jgi:hypothetical protein